MAWLIILAVCTTFSTAVLGWKVRRMKTDIYQFADRLETALDLILSGKEASDICEDTDTLWGKIGEKLCRASHVWQRKELENLHEKQELEQLISHLSHQTKTPISNLKICIELLREHPVLNKSEEFVTILQAQSPAYNCESTKQLREFLDIMESQPEKLDFLIQGMIKMSRLETGMIKIQASRLNLQTTIGRAVSEIVPKAEKKQIRLYVNCNPNIQVRHDGKWTEEAIFNILDNAVKYTETGGSIRITVTKQEIFTQIAIRDTGKGIAPLRHAEIFTRFYREPEVHDQEGIGIGLYLAREIIELQSGYIQVRSEEGKGAEFQICLLNSYEK